MIQDAKKTAADIKQVVLVGGSTRIPRVQRMLTGFFGGRNLIVPSEVDEGVVNGAAVRAAMCLSTRFRSEKISSALVLDVVSFGYCVRIDNGNMATILKRNTSVPAKKYLVLPFSLDNSQHRAVLVYIFEATGPLDTDTQLLSDELSLDIPPPMTNGFIEVTFDVDTRRQLTVKAKETSTGTENSVKIGWHAE